MSFGRQATEPMAALQMVGNALNALAGDTSIVVRRRVAAMWVRKTVKALKQQGRPLSPGERARVAAIAAVLEDAAGKLAQEPGPAVLPHPVVRPYQSS